MMQSKTLRIALLSAALATISFTGFTRAADEPAKPAEPTAPAPAPAPTGRPRFDPAEMLKTYRDQFEGLTPALSEDQMKKIDGFLETAETEVKANAGKEDQDSRRASFQAIRKLGEDVQSILTDAQKTALGVKRTSMMVDRAKKVYTNPDLKLSDEQTSKINEIFDGLKKDIAALPAPAADDREARRKPFELMRSATEKAKALLTPDQQKLIPAMGGGRRGNRGGNPPAAPTPPPAA